MFFEAGDVVVALIDGLIDLASAGGGGGDAGRSALAAGNLHHVMRTIEDGDDKIERVRWREQHKVEWSFPAGTVATGPLPGDLTPASVAVTDTELIFISESPDSLGTPTELARIKRDAVEGVDAYEERVAEERKSDPDGPLDPDVLARVVLHWRDERRAVHSETFVFHSASVAGEAAERFRRATASAPP